MKTEEINITKKAPICIGTGLVALDVIISDDPNKTSKFLTGGSCGNVTTILSYLGWESYPVARLSNNAATDLLLHDIRKWKVKEDLLSFTTDGSTPIIIHRILKDSNGRPKHKFEFRNPEDGSYLPSYKPCLAKSVQDIIIKSETPRVFYFDRINRASIELAKRYKEGGSVVFFEPSSIKDIKGFKECLELTDILKFSEDRIPDFDHLYPFAQVPLEIQTLGERGLKFRRKGCSSWHNISSYLIDDVVDAAGAGDWCSSGIIMSLFKTPIIINNVRDEEIINSIKFGQILSALNCTFEGARGLMYNINNHELLSLVDSILGSGSQKIFGRSRTIDNYQGCSRQLKISSLLEPV